MLYSRPSGNVGVVGAAQTEGPELKWFNLPLVRCPAHCHWLRGALRVSPSPEEEAQSPGDCPVGPLSLLRVTKPTPVTSQKPMHAGQIKKQSSSPSSALVILSSKAHYGQCQCDLPEGSVHLCTGTMEAAGVGGAGTLQLQGPGETLSCYSLCGSGSDDGLCASVSSSIK